MSKKRIQLKEVETKLLQFSAGDLIPELSSNKNLVHVKQAAFDYYNEKTKEVFQVQVTVTRCESDFLEPFQTEEMTSYKPS